MYETGHNEDWSKAVGELYYYIKYTAAPGVDGSAPDFVRTSLHQATVTTTRRYAARLCTHACTSRCVLHVDGLNYVPYDSPMFLYQPTGYRHHVQVLRTPVR